MKYLVALLFTASIFAQTFSTNQTFDNSIFDRGYDLKTEVELSALAFKNGELSLSIDGEFVKVKATEEAVLDDLSGLKISMYSATVKTDVIDSLRYCLPHDVVSYELDFLVKNYKYFNKIVVEATLLTAKRAFTPDYCHDGYVEDLVIYRRK